MADAGKAAVRQSDAVIQEVKIDASPERVFEFLTDSDKMTLWKGREATVVARPGGAHRVVINDRAIASGEYVEVDPPRRIVLTWGWEGAESPVPAGSSRVEITLEPAGDGTLVRLVHTDLPEAERDNHADGWSHYLGRLSVAATGGDPGPDPNETATP